MVSNTTVNHQGYGAYAWAIWSQQLLWSGNGCIPIDQLNMYSGLAEVFGVYHSLQVLTQYINQYPLICHKNPRAVVYCNNQGVIEQITSKLTDQQPQDMICNNYPIFQEVDQLLHHPIRITFHHVEGHLDTWKPK